MGRKSIKKERNLNPKKRLQLIQKIIPIVSKHGIKAITMDDLAAHLSISKTTLYNYFSTREEIVSNGLKYILSRINTYQKSLSDNNRSFLDRYVGAVKVLSENVSDISNLLLSDIRTEYPHLWKLVDAYKENATMVLAKFYEDGQNAGVFKKFETNIPVLTDRLFIDALSDPKLLEANNLTLEKALREYFMMKCFGILNSNNQGEMLEEVEELIQNI